MKINIKKPELNINIRKKKKDPKKVQEAAPQASSVSSGFAASYAGGSAAAYGAAVFGVPGISAGGDTDNFEVNVRNANAGIQLLDSKAAEEPWWRRELPHEIATGAALMTLIAFLLSAAYLPRMIPLTLIGVAAYMGLVLLGERFDVRFKYYAAAGITVLLVVLAVVLRRYIGGGIGSIMNMVYDASEAEQAYIYTRLGTGAADEMPDLCARVGIIWASVLFGTIGSVPSAPARRVLGLAVAGAAMIAFAYYGIIPTTVIVVIAIVAVMMVLSRGGMMAAIPVLLASLLLFGAVMLIDPGENYAISRKDENIRDRLALRSAYLETDLETEVTERSDNLTREDEEEEIQEQEQQKAEANKKLIATLLITAALLAAIAGAVYLIYRRYIRRRNANRAGIDSDDARTAIVAMFPYAIKWLGTANIDVQGKSFASLVEPLSTGVSEQYSNYFKSMYVLWREAAYSDHAMDDEKKIAMKEFLSDTKQMVQTGMSKPARIKTAVKYAL